MMQESEEPRYRVIGRWVFAAGAICFSTAIPFVTVGKITLYMLVAGLVLMFRPAITRPFGEL